MGEIADIQGPIMEAAENSGWLARRLQYINRRGAPDALFLKDGVFVLMEFKRPGRGFDPRQSRERKRISEHGATVHLVTSFKNGIQILRDEHAARNQ